VSVVVAPSRNRTCAVTWRCLSRVVHVVPLEPRTTVNMGNVRDERTVDEEQRL
jgi:hypothetical protein